MLASAKAYEVLIQSAELKELLDKVRGVVDENDGVYIGTPDFDNTTDAQIVSLSPWVRVSDLPGDDTEYSDDMRFIEYPRVQIDFWTRKELIPDASQIDDLIRQIMQDAGWERVTHDSYVDRDTPALRMVSSHFQSLGFAV